MTDSVVAGAKVASLGWCHLVQGYTPVKWLEEDRTGVDSAAVTSISRGISWGKEEDQLQVYEMNELVSNLRKFR